MASRAARVLGNPESRLRNEGGSATMRAYQVFATLEPERAEALFRGLQKKSPEMFTNAVAAASGALKSRPGYLLKQPFPKRVQAVRRALSRVASNTIAEEIFAVYFLEVKQELLVEWLDGVGLEHDEGSLEDDHPEEPEKDQLEAAVKAFRAVDDDLDRELLLRAFAAQSAIDWPALEALLDLEREPSDPA